MKHLAILALLGMVASAQAWAVPDGDAAQGKAKSSTCAACHGVDGNSQAAMFPRLAGQHPDYLYQALTEYKSGERKNAIMSGQVTNLSEQDMADLAAYFGSCAGLHSDVRIAPNPAFGTGKPTSDPPRQCSM